VVSALTYGVSISLDGYVAGPDQSPDHPLGVHGDALHVWMRELAAWRRDAGLSGGETNASTPVYESGDSDPGAILMGRNMFGGSGAWEDGWIGWWGEDPPFHLPVFVVTHHPRATLHLGGGTSFTFVHDGVDAAVAQAREAAGGRDVAVSGGATLARQLLVAGLVDELTLHLVPVLLGAGIRLFDDPGMAGIAFRQEEVVPAPGVTHLRYRSAARDRAPDVPRERTDGDR
jgi:dihydrofolate reductase